MMQGSFRSPTSPTPLAHGSENRRGHVVQSATLSVLDVDVLVQRFQKVVIQH